MASDQSPSNQPPVSLPSPQTNPFWFLPEAFHAKPHLFPADTSFKSKEGAVIRCNKAFLAGKSDYFDRLFFPSHPHAPQADDGSLVDMSDFTEQELQLALCFVHRDKPAFREGIEQSLKRMMPRIHDSSAATAVIISTAAARLLVFADRYQIRGFSRAVHGFLVSFLFAFPKHALGALAAGVLLQAGELCAKEHPPPLVDWALDLLQKQLADSKTLRLSVNSGLLMQLPKVVLHALLSSSNSNMDEPDLCQLAATLATLHADPATGRADASFLQHVRLGLLPADFLQGLQRTYLATAFGAERLQAAIQGRASGTDKEPRLAARQRQSWTIHPDRFLPADYASAQAALSKSPTDDGFGPLLSAELSSPSPTTVSRSGGCVSVVSLFGEDDPADPHATAAAILAALEDDLYKKRGGGTLCQEGVVSPIIMSRDARRGSVKWLCSVPDDCSPLCQVGVGALMTFCLPNGQMQERLLMFKDTPTHTELAISDPAEVGPPFVLRQFPVRLLRPGNEIDLYIRKLDADTTELNLDLVRDVTSEERAAVEGVEGVKVWEGNGSGKWYMCLQMRLWTEEWQGIGRWCVASFVGEVANGRLVLQGVSAPS